MTALSKADCDAVRNTEEEEKEHIRTELQDVGTKTVSHQTSDFVTVCGERSQLNL